MAWDGLILRCPRQAGTVVDTNRETKQPCGLAVPEFGGTLWDAKCPASLLLYKEGQRGTGEGQDKEIEDF